MECLHIGIVLLLCTEVHETEDVGIHPAAADLVSARLWEICSSETCEKRSDHHHRSTELGTLCHEIRTHYIVCIDFVSLEGIYSFLMSGHLHSHAFKKQYEILDVQNFRDVRYLHLLLCKKHRTDDLKRLVLGTLWPDGSAELMSAFYYE